MGVHQRRKAVDSNGAANGDPNGDAQITDSAASSSSSFSWLRRELEYQRTMLPGIDNLWLLMTGGRNDFSPVWCVRLCSSNAELSNLALSMGTYTFADEIDYEGVLRTWDEMSTRYPAYHSVLHGLNRRFHTARLVASDTFDIRDHVTLVHLPPGKNGKRALEDATAALAAQPWDLSRPLWDAQVLHGYDDGTGAKSALAIRAHHSQYPFFLSSYAYAHTRYL
jgi:hypothetical protein